MHTRHKGYRTIPVLLATLALCHAAQASAADDPHLLGDWNGARSRLADRGATFDVGYVSELARNFSGGTRELSRHADQWTFGSTFDLEKLWGWDGTDFQIVMTRRSGDDLGSHAAIGNNQLLQEVYGRGQTWHLTVFALDRRSSTAGCNGGSGG